MTNLSTSCWEKKRTDETRNVENVLGVQFEKVDAYRYNSASIRVRVIDPRFKGVPHEKRDEMIEPLLAKLPERTQADIITLFLFTPEEILQSQETFKQFLMNSEFEDPSPSML